MKTLFQVNHFAAASPWMGSAAEGRSSVDETMRDDLLSQITPRTSKMKELNALVDWSKNNDPYLQKLFGDDRGAFWLMWGKLKDGESIINGISKRMSEQDPEFWSDLSDMESGTLDFWTQGVDDLYKMYQERMVQPVDLVPGEKPPPGARAVQVISPAVPQAPAAASASSTGPTPNQLLIGGLSVVALGLFVYYAS